MKRTLPLLSLFAVVALVFSLAAHAAPSPNWDIDPVHSLASFSVRHMGISNVKGEFTKVSGQGYFDGKNFDTAAIEATIDVASLSTREPKRDAHLKSPDFLDVEKYPTMTFKSKRIHQTRKGTFKMTGDLTIHGVTRTVVFDGVGPSDPVTVPGAGTRMGASASTVINRKDFGLVWNKNLDNGALLVGDEVTINLDIEAVKK